jgi:DNA-binding NarL/FixJ family response regulator
MRRNVSVLIVDDNPGFVQRMSGLLGEIEAVNGIYSAGNYDDAIKLIDQQIHDMVLLDINLPGKNGISLLEQLKERGRASGVIMLSNHSGIYYRNKCKKLGARHFLDKTTEFEKVPCIINELLVDNKISLS